MSSEPIPESAQKFSYNCIQGRCTISTSSGRRYSCDCRQIAGLLALIAAALAFVFASIIASGTFGVGTMNFIAGGLAVSTMILAGLGVYLLSYQPSTYDVIKPGDSHPSDL
jgi:hypothetical protein